MANVLMVEDNTIFRETFKKGLQDRFTSVTVETAISSEEALQKIKEVPPQLIFTDIRLPGMNGLQLTEKIKKEFPGIIVAIVTGYDLPEYRQAALQYGADHFFIKDALKWEDISEFIQSVLPSVS